MDLFHVADEISGRPVIIARGTAAGFPRRPHLLERRFCATCVAKVVAEVCPNWEVGWLRGQSHLLKK